MSWHRYGKRSRPRKLTDAQLRLLAEVVKTGSKSYNGRISKSLEALEDFGLVESDFYVRSAGGGDGYTQVHIVTAIEPQASERVEEYVDHLRLQLAEVESALDSKIIFEYVTGAGNAPNSKREAGPKVIKSEKTVLERARDIRSENRIQERKEYLTQWLIEQKTQEGA